MTDGRYHYGVVAQYNFSNELWTSHVLVGLQLLLELFFGYLAFVAFRTESTKDSHDLTVLEILRFYYDILEKFFNHVLVFGQYLRVFCFGSIDPPLRLEKGQSQKRVQSLQYCPCSAQISEFPLHCMLRWIELDMIESVVAL